MKKTLCISIGFLLWLGLPTHSFAAITFVQAASNGSNASVATSIAATISAAPTGALIAGVVTWGNSTLTDLTSVTDGKGNAYTIVRRVNDGTNNQTVASFYGYNITGGPTAITANFAAPDNFRGISVEVFSGALTSSSPLDGTNEQGQLQAAPGTGANAVKSGTGTQTPGGANYLVVGGSTDTGTLATGVSKFTAGTNFTKPTGAEFTTSGAIAVASEYWIQTTATAANASFTASTASAHVTFQMIFKVDNAVAATKPRFIFGQSLLGQFLFTGGKFIW